MSAQPEPEDWQAERERLIALVNMGREVVEDFLPNIARCALQDYGRLNEFLCGAAFTRPPRAPLPPGADKAEALMHAVARERAREGEPLRDWARKKAPRRKR